MQTGIICRRHPESLWVVEGVTREAIEALLIQVVAHLAEHEEGDLVAKKYAIMHSSRGLAQFVEDEAALIWRSETYHEERPLTIGMEILDGTCLLYKYANVQPMFNFAERVVVK